MKVDLVMGLVNVVVAGWVLYSILRCHSPI